MAPFLPPLCRCHAWGMATRSGCSPALADNFRSVAHGQAIFVDPASHLVVVPTVRLKPSADPVALERGALWQALVARYGR